jgi:hypothetical protein
MAQPTRVHHRNAARTVGTLAAKDPVLARASLVASVIIKNAVNLPIGQQAPYIVGELNRVQTGLGAEFMKQLRQIRGRGERGMTATFNAIRLVLSNAVAADVVQYFRTVVASGGDAEALGDTAQDVGCGITGGVGIVAGLIGSIYGGQAGGTAAGAGTQVLGQALNCDHAAQASAQAVAAANAQTAAANLAAAQAQAQSQAQLAAQQSASTQNLLMWGIGGTLALIVVGGGMYYLVK